MGAALSGPMLSTQLVLTVAVTRTVMPSPKIVFVFNPNQSTGFGSL